TGPAGRRVHPRGLRGCSQGPPDRDPALGRGLSATAPTMRDWRRQSTQPDRAQNAAPGWHRTPGRVTGLEEESVLHQQRQCDPSRRILTATTRLILLDSETGAPGTPGRPAPPQPSLRYRRLRSLRMRTIEQPTIDTVRVAPELEPQMLDPGLRAARRSMLPGFGIQVPMGHFRGHRQLDDFRRPARLDATARMDGDRRGPAIDTFGQNLRVFAIGIRLK